MPKGIAFSPTGEMCAVKIAEDIVMDELRELIGSREIVPVPLEDGVALWLDANAESNGVTVNSKLTRLAYRKGLDWPIYGAGVVIGSDGAGEDAPVRSLSPTERLNIVLAYVSEVPTHAFA